MKKDNKDHSNLLLTLSAFMLIISICTFIYIYNDIFPDINKFPVSIWGTVSDWVMVGITVTTAVFLYRTLNSQMIVQKDQETLLNIEVNRFRDEFVPYIAVNSQHPVLTKIGEEIFLNFEIRFYKNKCKDLIFYSNYPLEITVKNRSKTDYTIIPSTNTNNKIKKDNSYRLIDITLWEQAVLEIKLSLPSVFHLPKKESLILHFKDIKGYNYETTIEFSNPHNLIYDFERQTIYLKTKEIIYL